jgi:pentatricopeptide repeat protein
VLSACARLGALDLGKWVHVRESWLQGKCYVGNALMDMYAKCGVVETAFDVFKSMDKKDLISWNTIIGGLAVHGHGADAFNLFSQTKSAGGNLDLITFIGILCACTHTGLVEDGLSYFKSMTDNIQLRLRLNTMVVLLIC